MKNKFAQQLKKLRSNRGLSQAELAEQLFISRQAVSKWEAGTATPDLNTLIKLTELLECSLDELVSAQPSPGEQPVPSHQMNGWEFLHRDWWLIFPVGGFLVWALKTLVPFFS
ncbi:helix-turn-helix transcriptional regulator [Fructilactobacillus ixorae]|uniref:Helix-turn-helix transcriptional regulator n=1 Tax=Fructilactobacillus ixorae TaxID=1750535 RepID=A0ABY5C2E2_9LACO|nr:helix-turn-helix transcriptional regulator [Fructilactobacillus ixorae]USS92945.1 helix-turn-helix transcriptional regulator [Fructilactobacillus ixorae]